MNQDKTTKPKIGAGHAAAMARLGLKELRSAAAPDSPIVQPSEPGLYGHPTQGEVADSRKPEDSREEPQDRTNEQTERTPGDDGREPDDDLDIDRD